jgi:hypothetical protein
MVNRMRPGADRALRTGGGADSTRIARLRPIGGELHSAPSPLLHAGANGESSLGESLRASNDCRSRRLSVMT